MTRRQKILVTLSGIYLISLTALAIAAMSQQSRILFGLLFIGITLGPAGRFFLNRNEKLQSWLSSSKN
ncbi:MAG: hypothetical protein JXR59_00210 [Desulfuromonadaceae bacterium]|nr:hypothetical protein [Desulfuromonadaceae bacterium]